MVLQCMDPENITLSEEISRKIMTCLKQANLQTQKCRLTTALAREAEKDC